MTYKQCIKVSSVVYAEEESLHRSFLTELKKVFKENSIKFYEFLWLFVENYKNSMQDFKEDSIAPFFPERPQNETFGDSIINIDFEPAKALSIAPPAPPQRPLKESNIDRPLPKGPFEKIRQSCVDYCEKILVHQFVMIVLNGYFEENLDSNEEIVTEIETVVIEKMNGLIDALCKFDKRKWMDVLGTDNKDSLKHCENLQKKLREIHKKNPEANEDDVDLICKEILQTPDLKLFISKKVQEYFSNFL